MEDKVYYLLFVSCSIIRYIYIYTREIEGFLVIVGMEFLWRLLSRINFLDILMGIFRNNVLLII